MTSTEKKAVREALESAGGALASLTMDVGADRKLAWVWHILNDWEEAFDEVADKCKWSPEDRERVKRYRKALSILDKSEGVEDFPKWIEKTQRREDMSQRGRLELSRGVDGDIGIKVLEQGDDGLLSACGIEFCTVGSGGGKSPHTFRALLGLMVAMEKDNALEKEAGNE